MAPAAGGLNALIFQNFTGYPVLIYSPENLPKANGLPNGNGGYLFCNANKDADQDFAEHYGCLYTFEDAMKICPSGWHLPTSADFENLLNYVGKSDLIKSQKLRATSWDNGLDTFGFAALPTGYHYSGNYMNFGTNTNFWSSTEKDTTLAYYFTINNKKTDIFGSYYKEGTFSVRCMKR